MAYYIFQWAPPQLLTHSRTFVRSTQPWRMEGIPNKTKRMTRPTIQAYGSTLKCNRSSIPRILGNSSKGFGASTLITLPCHISPGVVPRTKSRLDLSSKYSPQTATRRGGGLVTVPHSSPHSDSFIRIRAVSPALQKMSACTSWGRSEADIKAESIPDFRTGSRSESSIKLRQLARVSTLLPMLGQINHYGGAALDCR